MILISKNKPHDESKSSNMFIEMSNPFSVINIKKVSLWSLNMYFVRVDTKMNR